MITLTLPYPPSVNTYYRRGKYATYLSPKGREFKAQVADLVSEYHHPIENALKGRLGVFMSISSTTRRRYDIDNRIKAVLDALQDAGVFDNDEQIDEIVVKRMPPGGGYCKIVIIELEKGD